MFVLKMSQLSFQLVVRLTNRVHDDQILDFTAVSQLLSKVFSPFVPMFQFTYVPLHPRRPGMTLWERICHSPIAPASKFEPMPAVPNMFRLLFALWA